MKLALGTVQFGLNYGITNKNGQLTKKDAHQILDLALKNKIDTIDTAAAYGTSEVVLGEYKQIDRFKIVTKIPKLNSISNTDGVVEVFKNSLKKLNQKKIYGLIVHNAEDLMGPHKKDLYKVLSAFKEQGLVKKIGVSVYSSSQIDYIIDHFKIDLVQIPLNVLDQRLFSSGHLQKLKKNSIEIHVRSAFLQGLLLMPPSALQGQFSKVQSHLMDYHTQIQKIGLTALESALLFLKNKSEVDRILVGITSIDEFNQVLESYHHLGVKKIDLDYSKFAYNDESIVNPSLWR